jgi:hypothetical protein
MKGLSFPAVERVRVGKHGVVAFRVPADAVHEVAGYFYYQEKDRPPFYTVKIDKPRKPRSTGEKSQNHHINGHCQQIAQHTGNDFETVKEFAKCMAVSMGYPFMEDSHGTAVRNIWGKTRGISEADCSTEDAAILIEAIHRLAAELDVELMED